MMHQNWEHLDRVADTMDIIGVNYYIQDALRARSSSARWVSRIRTTRRTAGRSIGGAHATLMTVYNRYGKPIVVSKMASAPKVNKRRCATSAST